MAKLEENDSEAYPAACYISNVGSNSAIFFMLGRNWLTQTCLLEKAQHSLACYNWPTLTCSLEAGQHCHAR
jgi:hypothetical protein